MKRFLRTTSVALALLFLISLAAPSDAFGVGTIEAYTHQSEAQIGEEIVWYVAMTGWSNPSECAFLLYHDAELIAYEPPSGATVYRYTPQEPGTYSLVALARDGTGVRSANGGSVVVFAPLRIVSVAANRPRIALGAVATWTASVEGGSGGARYGFFVYRDGELLKLCVPDDPESGVLNYTPEQPGTYTVDVLAMDVSGNAKLAGAPVIVAEEAQGTEPLKLTSVFANTSDALVGEEIAWTATASGGEDQIAFSFFLYRDGELVSFSPVGTSSVFRMTPTEPGVYAVTAHAASGFEGANLMSGEVTVARPSGVRVTGVACDRNKAILGEPLTWTAQTEDAAGEVSYSFALYRDWALMGLYETGASPAFSIAPGEIGTYSVVAYAKDGVRSASASSAGVRVVSQALTIDSVTADQLTGVVGKPITWTVHTTSSENLHYMYFVYLNWEHVYSSDVTTQNTFTYTPTGSVNFYRYYIEGFVSDGEQTASFKSPVLPVAEEGRPRILSIVPDRAIAYPGEKITWTVAVDYGADSSDTIGQIAFWLFLDQDELAVNYTEYAQVTSYSYAPTKPGTYRLRAAIDTGFSYLVAEAPAVRVIDPTMADFAMSFDPDRLPDIALPDATPAPTLIPSRIEGPDVDFSRALATTRPPMAPDKPKSTAKPTPKPTVDLTLPNFQKQEIRLP